MKKLTLVILFGLWGQLFAATGEIRSELPVGTTFAIKTDFWVYEITGRILRRGLPRAEGTDYTMNSVRGGGIGGWGFKYTDTLPAGTRFEVVSLIKKNKRNWFYIVKTKGYTDPKIGERNIIINPTSMLVIRWGKKPFSDEYYNSKATKLHPDLFTDFIYPTE